MQDNGLNAAQRQYDNQLPPRYNRTPVCNCYYCDSDIYCGEKYAIIYGKYICCTDCLEFEIAEKEEYDE